MFAIIGCADDGCSSIFCTSCKSNYHIRYGKNPNFCLVCGEHFDKIIERKMKKYYPSSIANQPISMLDWEIVQEGPDRSYVVWSTDSYHWYHNKRTLAYKTMLEYRQREEEFQNDHQGFEDLREKFYIRKKNKHAWTKRS